MSNLKNPTDLLLDSDLEILKEAQALCRAGLTEATGIALKGAVSRLLKCQTDLSNLKGMILYTISFKKADMFEAWKAVDYMYYGEKLPYHKIEMYANCDSKYKDLKIEVSGYESLLAVIEDNLWALRTIIKSYQSQTFPS